MVNPPLPAFAPLLFLGPSATISQASRMFQPTARMIRPYDPSRHNRSTVHSRLAHDEDKGRKTVTRQPLRDITNSAFGPTIFTPRTTEIHYCAGSRRAVSQEVDVDSYIAISGSMRPESSQQGPCQPQPHEVAPTIPQDAPQPIPPRMDRSLWSSGCPCLRRDNQVSLAMGHGLRSTAAPWASGFQLQPEYGRPARPTLRTDERGEVLAKHGHKQDYLAPRIERSPCEPRRAKGQDELPTADQSWPGVPVFQ